MRKSLHWIESVPGLMPMTGEGGRHWRGRMKAGGQQGACAFRQEGAAEPMWPAAPSPLPAWGQPLLLGRWGGKDGTALRRGANVPTAAHGRECPALRRQGRAPRRPCPPPAPRPPAQGPEGRARPPLVVGLEEGEEERGEAQSGPGGGGPDGAPPLLPESVPAGSPPPGRPTDPVSAVPMGQGGKLAAGIFFFSFFFLVIKKFLGLGEILCATAVPRGVLPPTPLPLPPGGREEEEFLGRAKVGEGGTISHPPQSWKKRPSRAGTGCQVPAEGTRCPAPPGAPPLSRPGRPGCAVAGPAAG